MQTKQNEDSIWAEMHNKMAEVKRIENEQNRLLEELSSEDKALFTAIKQGSLTDIKNAVAQGGNPKFTILGGNLLFWLGQNNSADVVESAAYLIDEIGLDVNQRAVTQAAPLNSCIINFPVFAFYLTRGADINHEVIPGTSLFSQIAVIFNAEQIRYLLKNFKINLDNEMATGAVLNAISLMKKDVAVVLVEEIAYPTVILDKLLSQLVSMELDSFMSALINSFTTFGLSLAKQLIANQNEGEENKNAAIQNIDKIFSLVSTHELTSEFPVIVAMLEKGANPNCHNSFKQPILCDLVYDRFDRADKKAKVNRLMQCLFNFGADPHAQFDYYGNACTPLKKLLERDGENIEQIKLMLLSKRGLSGITLENANTFIRADHPCHAFLLAGLKCQSAVELIGKRIAENSTDNDAAIYDLLDESLADGPEFLLKCLNEIHALPEEQNMSSFEYLINYLVAQGPDAIPVKICELVSTILIGYEDASLDHLLLTHLFAARTHNEQFITSLYCRIMQVPDRIGTTLASLAVDYPEKFTHCEQLIKEFQQKHSENEPVSNTCAL